MNYHYAGRVYRNYGPEDTLTDDFSEQVKQEFASLRMSEPDITECRILRQR
jgi:hypothetical protein